MSHDYSSKTLEPSVPFFVGVIGHRQLRLEEIPRLQQDLVVSKFDCTEVTGSMSFDTDAGKTLEYIDARVTNVNWGEPFIMQFDATSKGAAATKIDLFDLKCIR